MEAEFGDAQWLLGMSTYAFESESKIICTYSQRGISHLAILDTSTRSLEEIETPYSEMWGLHAGTGRLLFNGGSPRHPACINEMDLNTRKFKVLHRSSEIKLDAGYMSVPKEIEYPSEKGMTAFAFLYSPRNKDYRGPTAERPPLLVICHGGPTSATSAVFNLEIQFWTSRGIAVLDVNYGGSTGYGREYRQRLRGQWGLVDVNDCVNGARYLVHRGKVDGERLMISGGSAGGYTALCALAFKDVFKAGASYFGVSDIEALAKKTHKFESHYFDSLVGPYPESRRLYLERSPIHSAERLSGALIIFQGLEDEIVPPDQSLKMFQTLRAKGLPVAYLAFEGEQHGLRRAENMKRALEAEIYFYSRVLGFKLADSVEPIEIENLNDKRKHSG